MQPEDKLSPSFPSKKKTIKKSKKRGRTFSQESVKLSPSSTKTNSLWSQPQNSEECYQVNSQILQGSMITEKHRMILKDWMLQFTKAHHYHRQTYSLSGYYLDLFFKNGGQVTLQQFQNLGIACFHLAAKTVEKNRPNLRYFDLKQILRLEQLICFRLEFRMTPITCVRVVDELLCSWDQFVEDTQIYDIYYFNQSDQSYARTTYFYELLDCASYVLKTLDYDLCEIVLNLFFIQNRVNCELTPRPKNSKDLVNKFYKKDQYFKSFQQFMSHVGYITHINLNFQIGEYLINFFLLPKNDKNILPEGQSQIDKYMKQTFNIKAKEVAKKVILKYNQPDVTL